jgi:RimJ/RimL family protein N-acetyltransferase
MSYYQNNRGVYMVIKSDRIIIKNTEEKDLENIKNLWNNGEVMKWVGSPQGLGQSIEDIKEWFSKIKQSNLAYHFIVLDKDEKFCGELFYLKNIESRRAGLDIKFLPRGQGRGLATESLRVFIDYIFDNEKNIQSVWTEPSVENKAARKLYTRCRLQEKERPEDMEPAESYWELTRAEWKKNSKKTCE